MVAPEKNNNRPNTYSELLNGKNKRADLRLSLAVMSADVRNVDSAKFSDEQLNEAPKPPRRLIPNNRYSQRQTVSGARADATPGRSDETEH